MTDVIVCGKREYVVTDDDALWMLRAVQCEGPVQLEVAQTLVNLFAYLHSRKPLAARSLTWLVRSYAQPVNPRWFPYDKGLGHGDLHKKWLERGQDTEKHAIRRRDVHSVRTHFDRGVVQAVHKALRTGPVDIPRNCTDYAAARIDASHKYRPLTPAQEGRNRLWTRAPEWTGYSVRS